MRNILLLPDFANVASNGRAKLDVTLGMAYHEITLRVNEGADLMTVAQMKARIDTITVKLNGKPVQEWTPTSLDVANATNGTQYAASDGHLTLYFSEPWRRTMEGEEKGAWGTLKLDSFVIEVKFNANAVAPSITAWAVVDEYNRPIGAYPIRHVRNYTGNAVVQGQTQLPGLLKEVGLFYARIHFLSNLITKVKVMVNNVTKYDDVPRDLAAELMKKWRGLTMQANVYTLAFDATSQQLTDQLATFLATTPPVEVQDLRVLHTGSAAGTVDVVTEQYQFLK